MKLQIHLFVKNSNTHQKKQINVFRTSKYNQVNLIYSFHVLSVEISFPHVNSGTLSSYSTELILMWLRNILHLFVFVSSSSSTSLYIPYQCINSDRYLTHSCIGSSLVLPSGSKMLFKKT